MTDDVVRARVQQAMGALAERVRARSAQQMDAIDDALADVRTDALRESARTVAQSHAHQIAGTAGMYGNRGATDIARELDRHLGAPLTQESAVERALELAGALRASLAQWGSGSQEPRPGPVPASLPERPRVLLATADGLGSTIARQAQARGLSPVITAPGSLGESLRHDPPDAALVQVAKGQVEEGADLVAQLSHHGVPVVVLLPDAADTSTRLAAVRGGAHLLLEPPFESSGATAQIVDALSNLVTARGTQDHILAVDDDDIVLDAVRGMLVSELGARVTALNSPERFWSELKRLEPDLVLLDVDMPGISGLELCRAIRSDPRWRYLPVVVLSGKVDASNVQRVYGAGADDFVTKPVLGPELRARIGNRLERARLHRLLAETDPLTGLANRRRMETDYRRLQQLADRYGTSLSLTVIDLDRFKRVNDRYGHAVGDAVLRAFGQFLDGVFRGEDVVARLGGEEFIVGMLGMRKADARERVSAVLADFAGREQVVEGHRLRIGSSAGVAQYLADGLDFAALYRAADKALRRAKERGRGRVLIAGEEDAETADEAEVAIVDSSPVRAELLRHALAAAGYRCTVTGLGPARVERVPQRPELLTVLCDLDATDRDGRAMLQMLAGAAPAPQRILLLTADAVLADEGERLGASVELAAPFRVDAVLDRVHRMMRRSTMPAVR